MDLVARRVAWVDRLSRRLAMPVVPVGLPVAWTAVVEDPLANIEAAWEQATVALMHAREEMRGEEAPLEAGKIAAAKAPAGPQNRSPDLEPSRVNVARVGAPPIGLAPMAAAFRPHPAGTPDFPTSSITAFPHPFESLDRVAEAVAGADANRGRPALTSLREGASFSPKEGPRAGYPTVSPVHDSVEFGPTLSDTQAARAASMVFDSLHAIPGELPQPSLNAPAGARPVLRAAQPALTRLAQGPVALARLLQTNRDPRAATASSPPPAWSGAEPAALGHEGVSLASSRDPAVSAANDHIASEPRPVVTPATMDAILDELADRLRFELMREYGASSD